MALARGTYSESRMTAYDERNYKIKETSLGQSAYGITYRVAKGRKVFVMKELDIVQTTEENKQRCREEVEILLRIKHGNVVSYVESFSDVWPTKMYIVMDFMFGTLKKVLASGDPRVADERFIAGVMEQLCCGMAFIHSKKVIHRAVKPTNIFVQRGGIIKIGDFGLSQVLHQAVVPAKSWRISRILSGWFTSENTITKCGTSGYISPECLNGEPYGLPSDMWAVGRVLFDLCTRGAVEWNPTSLALTQRYSHGVNIFLVNLLSDDPSSRPTAADAHEFFRKLTISLRKACAGSCVPGRAVVEHDTVSMIIEAMGLAAFFN